MKSLNFSIIIFVLSFVGANNLFAQFYEPSEFDYGEQIGYEADMYADNTTSDPTWAVLNPDFLEKKSRVADIEEYNTVNINPFANTGDDFCWRESYGRGIGTIPTACPPGTFPNENRAGALCYKKCANDYQGNGPVCWKKCPNGWRDDGAFCNKPNNGAGYSRGAGRIPDVTCPKGWTKQGIGTASWCDKYIFPLVHTQASTKTCRSNEEWGGALCYPKCKPGYTTSTVNFCVVKCPDGWNDIGISCTKPSYGRGVGVIKTGCPDGKQNNAGLCYNACKEDFIGVGPVCWENICPIVNGKTWAHCGMACASSEGQCASAIVDMVISPLQAIANIAGMVVTFGASGAATVSANGAAASAKTFAKVVDVASKVGSAIQTSISVIESDLFQQFIKTNGRAPTNLEKIEMNKFAQMAYDATMTYEMSWKDFTGLDPTGLADIAAAYAHPLCKDVNGNTARSTTPTGADLSGLENRFVFLSDYSNYGGKSNNRINTEKGPTKVEPIHDGAWSAHWTLKPVSGGYYQIINRWKKTKLQIDTGDLTAGNISDSSPDGHWKIINAEGKPGGYKIVNRSNPSHILYWAGDWTLKSLNGGSQAYNVWRIKAQ